MRKKTKIKEFLKIRRRLLLTKNFEASIKGMQKVSNLKTLVRCALINQIN